MELGFSSRAFGLTSLDDPKYQQAFQKVSSQYPGLAKLATLQDKDFQSKCPPSDSAGDSNPPPKDTANLKTQDYDQTINKSSFVSKRTLEYAIKDYPKAIPGSSCYDAIRCYRDASRIVQIALGDSAVNMADHQKQVAAQSVDSALTADQRAQADYDFLYHQSTDTANGVKAVHDMMENQCQKFVEDVKNLQPKIQSDTSQPSADKDATAQDWGYSDFVTFVNLATTDIEKAIANSQDTEKKFNEQTAQIQKELNDRADAAKQKADQLTQNANYLNSIAGGNAPGDGSTITGLSQDAMKAASALGSAAMSLTNPTDSTAGGAVSGKQMPDKQARANANQANYGSTTAQGSLDSGSASPVELAGNSSTDSSGSDGSRSGDVRPAANSGNLYANKDRDAALPTITGLDGVNLASAGRPSPIQAPNLDSSKGQTASGEKIFGMSDQRFDLVGSLSPFQAATTEKSPAAAPRDVSREKLSQTDAGISSDQSEKTGKKSENGSLRDGLRADLVRALASTKTENSEGVGSGDAISNALEVAKGIHEAKKEERTNTLETKPAFSMDATETERALRHLTGNGLAADQQDSGLLGENSAALFARIHAAHLRFTRQ